MINETKEYMKCSETAKLLRASLKHNFPKVKFSVRSKTYSGGASINVDWTDGPTSKQVKEICNRFEGATFDGMQDCKEYHDTLLVGPNGLRRVHMGADFIFENRHYSDSFIQKAIDNLYFNFEGNFKAANIGKPLPEDYKQGDFHKYNIDDFDMQSELYKILSEQLG